MKEELCNSDKNDVKQSKFSYNGDNLVLREVFYKNCNSGITKFNSKEAIEYFENGLIKRINSEAEYSEGNEKNIYSYLFY